METPFPENPIDVLRINDAHRGPDADGTDLWSADQLAALPAQVYQYRVLTLVPELWPKGQRPSQTEYDADFRRRDPLAVAILRKINLEGVAPRIVVAGGAAAAPYYEQNVKAGDADFFAVGLTAELPKLASDFILALCDCQQELANSLGGGLGVLSMSEDALMVTLQVRSRCQTTNSVRLVVRKYQLFIKQAFSSGSAVVHSFDIPSSCTFYDGRTAWSSTLGAYAHLFRVNLVNPEYRTSTFEPRLIRYFNRRYYALGFVHLAAKALQTEKLQLVYFTIIPQQVRGNWAMGKLEGYDNKFTKSRLVSQLASPSLRLEIPTAEVARAAAKMVSLLEDRLLNRKTEPFKPSQGQLTEHSEAASKTLIDWWVKTKAESSNILNDPPETPEMWYCYHSLAVEPGKVSPDVLEQSLLAAHEHGLATSLAFSRCSSYGALSANRPCCCEGFDEDFDRCFSASLLLLK